MKKCRNKGQYCTGLQDNRQRTLMNKYQYRISEQKKENNRLIHTILINKIIEKEAFCKFTRAEGTQFYPENSKCFNRRYKDKGVIIIGYHLKKQGFSTYLILMKINLRKLINKDHDVKYLIDLINVNDANRIEEEFNKIVQEIGIDLPTFSGWNVSRIDYCINIKTPYVKEYISILHKSNIPKNLGYRAGDYGNYSKDKDSFYLVMKKGHKKKCEEYTRVNIYNKEAQLRSLQKKYNNITDDKIEEAKDILRVEAQCFKSKTSYLKKKYEMDTKSIQYFLDPQISHDVLYSMLKKIVRRSDYRREHVARKIIENRKGQKSTNEMLKKIVKDVAVQHNSVCKVKKKYIEEGMKRAKFNYYIRELDKLNVNPVTLSNNLKLKDKSYEEGLENLIDLFEREFNRSVYIKVLEDIEDLEINDDEIEKL